MERVRTWPQRALAGAATDLSTREAGRAPHRARPGHQDTGHVPLARIDSLPPTKRPPGLIRLLTRAGVPPLLVVLDLVAAAVSCVLTGVVTPGHLGFFGLVIILYGQAGLYRPRLTLSCLDDVPAMISRTAVAMASADVAIQLIGSDTTGELLSTAGIFVVASIVLRAIGCAGARFCRGQGWVSHGTLIIGAGKIGGHLASVLLAHPEYGLRPIGFLDRDPLLAAGERPVPLLGCLECLPKAIREHHVGVVIVAFPQVAESAMVEVLRTCDRMDCEIFSVPRLFELSHFGRDADYVWGTPLTRSRRAAYRSISWRLKRLLDITLAALSLVLLAPVLALCVIAVRLENGPGVFFRQVRVGRDGRPFTLLKFRSMRARPAGESDLSWTAEDGHIGPVGRLLRRTSLDETPQLWNVLRGQMSMVGPRPERPYFVETFTRMYPHYMARHRVRSGLTGWAQVHGLRGDTSIEERVRFDNAYIESWSLWSDVKILCRTLSHVFRLTGR